MNTIDSSATVRARIGLVELPELAGMLQHAGLQTITGPSFREAATAIKEGFAESTFPILVADASTAGLRAWVQRIHNTAAAAGKPVHIAVLRGEGAPVIVSENVVELHTPLTLNQILAAVKIAPVPGGDAFYPAVAAAPESAGFDLDFDFDELEAEDASPAAPLQQTQESAHSAPAAAPWETPAAAAPWEAPAAVDPQALPWDAPAAAPETPAPAVDIDWSTPAPAPAPAQAAEVTWDEPAPAPATNPAATDEFDWSTPAPAPATPAPSDEFDWSSPAPAAPAAASEFTWEEPAAPSAPAVEAQVAPAAADDEWDSAFPAGGPGGGFDWGTPAAAPVEAAPAPASEWDDAFPSQPAAIDWAAGPAADASPAPEPAAIDWGNPAAAAPAAHEEPATADWGNPVPAAAQVPADIDWSSPAPAAAPAAATFDWGTPAAAPVPETDRPEPGPAERTFTPAPPAATQAPVPVPVTPVHPAQQQPVPAGRYAAPAPQDWQGHGADPFRPQPVGPQGELIVTYSGKGGVGKSTSSLRLATIAADAGLKVILIDGNAAQGDLRTYMKLHRSNLPTIFDAAAGDVSKAVLRPDVINDNREQTLGKVNFAFVAAAPDEIYNKDIVTDAVYGQVIDYCRRHADLVILDTQIVEAADRSGVVDDIILPALVQDGWGIGISDMSSPGVNNLNHRLHKFIQNGVPSERLMVLLNRVPENQVQGATNASTYFNGRAKFLGVVEDDFQISRDMNAGRMQVTNRNLNTALTEALHIITGNPAFTATQVEEIDEPRSIFKRFFGGKKEVAAA